MAKNIESRLERLDDIFQRYNAKCDECYKSGDPMSVKGLAEFVKYGFIDAQGIIKMASEIRARASPMEKTKVLPAPAKVEMSEEERKMRADCDNYCKRTEGKPLAVREMMLDCLDIKYRGLREYAAYKDELTRKLGLLEERK